MLTLNPNKEKVLTFEVELSGATPDEVYGYVRFFVENVELGFPVQIGNRTIKAVIDPLKKLLKKPVKNGTVFEAQLDLFTQDEEYFSPWKGQIEVQNPVAIEAKITDDDDSYISENKKKVGAKVKSVTGGESSRRTVSERKKRLSRVKESKPLDSKMLDRFRERVDEEFIMKYLKEYGPKSERIRNYIFEQAFQEVGTEDYFLILKSVARKLKKQIN